VPSIFPALGALLAFLAQLVPASAPPAPLPQLVGQKLVVRMDGRRPDAELLRRVRLGQVGGVILYRDRNFTTPRGLRVVTATLQAASAAAGLPPLLIAVDQEGGAVRQVPWAPPALAPAQMRTASEARRQGAATGRALRRLGVNVDFAPVADVPATPRSFMLRSGRTWPGPAGTTGVLANAFADGLESAGVVPVMKHFPGLGWAVENTDSHVDLIAATRAELAPGLVPYRTAIAHRIPMIMLSNAVYAAYDGANAAGWSTAVATRLLRRDLGFAGVTITDSLDGAARARGLPDDPLAVRAARAGADMLLVTGSEAASRSVYLSLMAAARSGALGRAQLEESARRIAALRARL
jgi:beta-N-acetylhexosaminidase